MGMTKDLFNRIKKGRNLAQKGMELTQVLPRVTDIFTKNAELLFPETPRPFVKPEDPLKLLQEKLSPKKKDKKDKSKVKAESPEPLD